MRPRSLSFTSESSLQTLAATALTAEKLVCYVQIPWLKNSSSARWEMALFPWSAYLAHSGGIKAVLVGRTPRATHPRTPARGSPPPKRPPSRLYGAAEALREVTGIPMQYELRRALYKRQVAALHEQLDTEALKAAWAEGRAMTLEDAVKEAVTQGV